VSENPHTINELKTVIDRKFLKQLWLGAAKFHR